jgi:SulP family sulfate permease
VSVATFDWHSIAPATLKRMPLGETIVMVVTVGVVLATHNLAIGVVAGVLTAMVIFARRVAHMVEVTSVIDPDETTRFYAVRGELFFASSNDLVYQFDYANDPDRVVIDMSRAHIWDASSVAALDAVKTKYESRGKTVEIVDLNQKSEQMHALLAGTLNGAH